MDPTWWKIYTTDPMLLFYMHNPELETLDLSDCKLTDLPASIGGMCTLQNLNLAGNAFVTLPAALGELTNLDSLLLDDNPLAAHLAAMLKKVRLTISASLLLVRLTDYCLPDWSLSRSTALSCSSSTW